MRARVSWRVVVPVTCMAFALVTLVLLGFDACAAELASISVYIWLLAGIAAAAMLVVGIRTHDRNGWSLSGAALLTVVASWILGGFMAFSCNGLFL